MRSDDPGGGGEAGAASPRSGADGELSAVVAAEVERQLRAVRSELERSLAELRERLPEDRASIVVFSGELDRVLAAFVIATGAAAGGLETSMFFTFWGLSTVKHPEASAPDKSFKQRMIGLLTPKGSEELPTSRLNFFGVGARLLRSMMDEQGIASLEELIAMARELGVRMTACTMSMDAMGIRREELVDGLEYGGVAAFMADASRSRLSLFI